MTMQEKALHAFARKFECEDERLDEFLKESRTDNEGKTVCGMGEHDLAEKPSILYFDGNPHNLESAVCHEEECFLQQLDKQTIARIDGKEEADPQKADGGTGDETHKAHAIRIMSDIRFLSLRDTREVLYYEGGIYKIGGEVIIEEVAESIVEDCTTTIRNEIINTIRANTYIDRTAFDADPNIINVTNGLYDITTGKFSEHTPDYFSRVQLEAEYIPEASGERFLSFLSEILPDKSDQNTVLEMFGAVLVERLMNLEKILMLVGEGGNGKSTLLRTMIAIFGKKNCSFVSMHALENNRFSIAELDGKIANICADISNYEMKHVSAIKGLVSGDPVTAEKKNKPPFNFENHAKFFFSCNRLPEITEESEGVYRRFRIIEFLTSFRDKPDPHLLENLTTDEEKSGILNLLIHHAGTLLKNKALTHNISHDNVKREWKDRVNPIENFVDNHIKRVVGAGVPKDEMYQAYTEFCKRLDEPPKDKRGFSQKMSAMGFITKKMRIDGGSPVNSWVDVSLTDGSKDGSSGNGDDDMRVVDSTDIPEVDSQLDSSENGSNFDDSLIENIGDDKEWGKFEGGQVFKFIISEMGGNVKESDYVKELVKSGEFEESQAREIVGKLIDAKLLKRTGGTVPVDKPEEKSESERWYCDTCDAGPFGSDDIAFDGRTMLDFHSGHQIAKI